MIIPLELMLPVEGVEAQVGGKSVEGSNCVVVRPVDHPEAEPILDFFFCIHGLPGMTQLTRKSPIALRLILRGSPGPTA